MLLLFVKGLTFLKEGNITDAVGNHSVKDIVKIILFHCCNVIAMNVMNCNFIIPCLLQQELLAVRLYQNLSYNQTPTVLLTLHLLN